MITVYGASDDLVEIEGDVREEFSYRGGQEDDSTYLAFSDGTVLSIRYDNDGIWRIAPVCRGVAELKIEQAPADDEDNYSDQATLDGVKITWVLYGVDLARA